MLINLCTGNPATVPPYAIIVIWKYEDNRRYDLYGVGIVVKV